MFFKLRSFEHQKVVALLSLLFNWVDNLLHAHHKLVKLFHFPFNVLRLIGMLRLLLGHQLFHHYLLHLHHLLQGLLQLSVHHSA